MISLINVHKESCDSITNVFATWTRSRIRSCVAEKVHKISFRGSHIQFVHCKVVLKYLGGCHQFNHALVHFSQASSQVEPRSRSNFRIKAVIFLRGISIGRMLRQQLLEDGLVVEVVVLVVVKDQFITLWILFSFTPPSGTMTPFVNSFSSKS